MSQNLHPAKISELDLLADCEVKRTRASGPGGQHRNKVETAIVITHLPSGVTGQASERRSQNANREVALARLRVNLAVQVRTDVADTCDPSELWKSRLKAGKIRVSSGHWDFATLLAEALDFVYGDKFDVVTAAKRLQVSTSQLVKFLKIDPAAFQLVNREREKHELHRLK